MTDSRVEALLREIERQRASLNYEGQMALHGLRAALAGPLPEPASDEWIEAFQDGYEQRRGYRPEKWMLREIIAAANRRGSLSQGAPERCDKCDTVHGEWLDTPYPHSIQNPLPMCREVGFKHHPDMKLGDELTAEFKGKRWVVGYMPFEENPWGVHGPMDDGRDHVYPIAWLSTRRQAECVVYTLNAFAGASPVEPKVGEERLCVICARVRPWGTWDSKTGATVCAFCRDAARSAWEGPDKP